MSLPVASVVYLLGIILVGSGILLLVKNTNQPLNDGKLTKRSISNKIYNGIITVLTVLILFFIGYMWSVEAKSSTENLYDGKIFMTGVVISLWMIICIPLGIMSYKTRPKLV